MTPVFKTSHWYDCTAGPKSNLLVEYLPDPYPGFSFNCKQLKGLGITERLERGNQDKKIHCCTISDGE